METTKPPQETVSSKMSLPEIFNEIREEVSKERMVLNPPKTRPNIVDIQFEASDETGQEILYVRVASTDKEDVILPYIMGKIQKHSMLGQEYNLQKPLKTHRVDFFYIIQFSRK